MVGNIRVIWGNSVGKTTKMQVPSSTGRETQPIYRTLSDLVPLYFSPQPNAHLQVMSPSGSEPSMELSRFNTAHPPVYQHFEIPSVPAPIVPPTPPIDSGGPANRSFERFHTRTTMQSSLYSSHLSSGLFRIEDLRSSLLNSLQTDPTRRALPWRSPSD